MALEYFGSFFCKVRATVCDEDLLEMVRARARARDVLEQMRRDPGPHQGKPESEWTFTHIVRGPNGQKKTQMRVAELLRESAPLGKLAVHCIKCPTNVRSTDFGCGGIVSYPITVRAERWLLSRLPDDLGSAVGELLSRTLMQGRYDGTAIDHARRREDLFAARVSPERTWTEKRLAGLFNRRVRITSSQILQMILGSGHFRPQHARDIACVLGFENEDDPYIQPHPDDDRTIRQLKVFLRVVALAGASDVPVMISS